MRRFRSLSFIPVLAAIVLTIGSMTVLANGNDGHDGRGGDDGNHQLRAVPWVFVGTAAQCAPSPAGSRIVTSAWLGGMGLPDNGGANGALTTRNDPHLGLLLNKNGPTPDCSSSGATIEGVKGMTVDPATFTLGYDYRNGGHCGAGAPRFNLTIKTPGPGGMTWTYFLGCGASAQIGAPQDPSQWTQSRSAASAAAVQDPAQPATIPPNSKVVSLDIVFDEGTDTPSLSDPTGVGLAVLDNIYVNGTTITNGFGIEPGGGGREDDDHGGHDKGGKGGDDR